MIGELYRPQRNWGVRMREVVYCGYRMIILENEQLRLGILAGKGTDIIEINFKPRDLDFTWLTPGGVRNQATSGATSPDARAPFQENYPGGWQEIFPNGGYPSSHDGASHIQHGELFNVPWDVTVVDDTEEAVSVRFSVRARKIPCLLEKTVTLRTGEAGFLIEERLVNESPVVVSAMWGHHIIFGPPFLRPGMRLRLPDSMTAMPHPIEIAPGGRRTSQSAAFPWPVDPGNGTDFSVIPDRSAPSDVLYLTGFHDGDAWYEITDSDTGVGARVEWDADIMPFLWYWQEFGASTGYPWYGRSYNIGLEPFTSMPSLGLAEAVSNETALTIEPASDIAFQLQYTIIQAG